jgi:phage baseplate assembly protein V
MSIAERHDRRLKMLVGPVMITATDDTGPVHRVQVRGLPMETIDAMPAMQLYGVASHAPPGTDAAAIFVSGDRSNGFIVATNNQQYRLRNLNPGEVALYDNAGTIVKLAAGGNIEVTCTGSIEVTCQGSLTIKASKVTIDAPEIAITGDIELDGNLTATGAINAPEGSVGS